MGHQLFTMGFTRTYIKDLVPTMTFTTLQESSAQARFNMIQRMDKTDEGKEKGTKSIHTWVHNL